jgi:hypothetical protein
VRARLPPAITDELDEHVHHERKTEAHENQENSHCLQRHSLCPLIVLLLAWLEGANKPVKNGADGLKKSPRIHKDFVKTSKPFLLYGSKEEEGVSTPCWVAPIVWRKLEASHQESYRSDQAWPCACVPGYSQQTRNPFSLQVRFGHADGITQVFLEFSACPNAESKLQ